jgi:hypothetical protein
VNVVDLQQQFRSIAKFAEVAGASAKAVGELGAVADALAPFATLTVAQLALFLRAADEFAREGAVPTVPAKKPPTKRAPAKPKAGVVTQEEIVERVYHLYETIVHGNHSEEAISAELDLVDKLKGANLQALADKLNIRQAGKKLTVPQTKAKIREAVRERKSRYERSDY